MTFGTTLVQDGVIKSVPNIVQLPLTRGIRVSGLGVCVCVAKCRLGERSATFGDIAMHWRLAQVCNTPDDLNSRQH